MKFIVRCFGVVAAIVVALQLQVGVAASTPAGPSPQPVALAATVGPTIDQAAPSRLVHEEIGIGATYIARPSGAITIYDRPDGQPVGEVSATTGYGADRVLSVVGEPGPQWVQVRLDQRPNESRAWVKAAEVDITWTDLLVVIDLSDHELTLFEGQDVVLRGEIATGAADSPTPTGLTYVTEVLATPGSTIYGPFAIGLAHYSEALSEFGGGNGQIAIHGTDQPNLIGQNVSAGCVRTHNDLIRRLAGRLPQGTPVVIIA